MGKRVSPEERPYRPVQEALVRAVIAPHDAEQSATLDDAEGTRPRQEAGHAMQAEALTTVESSPLRKFTREKRVLLTQTEEREVERLVGHLAEELATPVKLSHMLRACMILLQHAENEIVKRARQATPLRRPPNGDVVALAQFEQRLAQILSAAFRDALPLR